MIVPAEGVELKKWSVVACDQYTSQPDYWQRVDGYVGDSPSTLRLVLPEIYLGREDTGARISAICGAMESYMADGYMRILPRGYMLTRRTLPDGGVRLGMVGAVDLEEYDFSEGSTSAVRATEGTVVSRIPPRVEVRRGALLELPHIMLLIDDPDCTVIEPLHEAGGELIYDFELMEGAGRLRGELITGGASAAAEAALRRLADPARLERKYGMPGKAPLVYAVGDGNHSLATAKTCWEEIKKGLLPSERMYHPARYALCELVNLHSPALQFEPIHRVLFDIDRTALDRYLGGVTSGEGDQRFSFVTADGERNLAISNPTSGLTVGSVEELVERFVRENGGRIDYVHGDEVARELGRGENAAAFLLPNMDKNDLFRAVMRDGSLPRKTFSMGHAADKRFYMEARIIRK